MAPELSSSASILKAEIHELLKTIQQDPGECRLKNSAAVGRVTSILESLPTRSPLPFVEAKEALWREKRVRVPSSQLQSNGNASLAVGFKNPSAIRFICNGSLLNKCKDSDTLEHDFIVIMPRDLFHDGDRLDYRYFTKRAFYLACIACGLSQKEGIHSPTFAFQDDNPLRPIISLGLGPTTPSQVRIIPIMDDGIFPKSAVYPWKACVRDEHPTFSGEWLTSMETTVYNSTITFESSLLRYEQSRVILEKKDPCFKQTCLLLVLWLRQRGFGTGFAAGGFGQFEVTAALAVLLRSKDIRNPHGRLAPLQGHETLQLFRSLLRFFAVTDLIYEPVTANADVDVLRHSGRGHGPVLFDGLSGLNLLFKMSTSSYKQLRFEARMTLECLSQPAFDSMSALFITRNDCPWLKFDDWLRFELSCILLLIELTVDRLRIPRASADPAFNGETEVGDSTLCERVFSALHTALGDRVALVYLRSLPQEAWSLSSPMPAPKDTDLSVGLISQPGKAERPVDRGPLAGNRAADAYRQFWGPKAELRRFQDGSIHESLAWSENTTKSPIRQIISYVISRHWHPNSEVVAELVGPETTETLGVTSAASRKAFEQLRTIISELSELPLEIQQIRESTSFLRSAAFKARCAEDERTTEPSIEATIQLEASSRWPNNMMALQRTKAAFLLKLGELLEQRGRKIEVRLGIEKAATTWLDSPFLDVRLGSVFLRYRLFQEKETSILENVLNSYAIRPELRRSVATAMASYKRTCVVGPAHVQAVNTLVGKFPAFLPSVKLFSRWCASHFLSYHLRPELLETLVAHVFTYPYPYTVPASPRTGLFCTLAMIARWDWQVEPLLVNLSPSMENAEAEAIRLRFGAWRKIDPSMNRVTLFVGSSLDPGGVAWTEGQIPPVVASRLRALARAAYVKITGQNFDPRANVLFTSPLAQYDFLIHLHIATYQKSLWSGSPSQLQQDQHKADLKPGLSADPVQNLLRELNVWYHELAVFFHGEGNPIIGGLWCPLDSSKQWRFNLGFSTVPEAPQQEPSDSVVRSSMQAEANRGGILNEIARLGSDLISSVEERSLQQV